MAEGTRLLSEYGEAISIAGSNPALSARGGYTAPPQFAPVAQLDRASVYGTEGQRFESSRARHTTRQIVRVSRYFDSRARDSRSWLGSSWAILAEFLANFWRGRRRPRQSSPPAATGVGRHDVRHHAVADGQTADDRLAATRRNHPCRGRQTVIRSRRDDPADGGRVAQLIPDRGDPSPGAGYSKRISSATVRTFSSWEERSAALRLTSIWAFASCCACASLRRATTSHSVRAW